MRWLIVLAILLAGCGPREIDARPAVWRASDGDSEIWLLGTIHALPPNVRWRTPAVERAIAGADTLVTEIPATDPETMARTFLSAATLPGLPPIAARIDPAQAPALDAAIAASGVSAESLNGMRSWAAAVTLAAGPMRAAGASGADGVEAVLAKAFAGRTHLALETQAGQLAVFNALPEAAQRVLLNRALADRDGYARTLAAWRAGDAQALAASFEPAFQGRPDLQEALVTARNRRWSRWIAMRMKQPGRVLVAVGAGHLVGRDSLPEMLRAEGVKMERIQ